MATIALFPGQGSQQVGMGLTLAERFLVARRVFEEVDDALAEPLSRLIFEGPSEELTMTRNAQPALLAVAVATARALEEMAGRPLGDLVDVAAGHSLGEYSALAAVGSLGLADAARLVRARGEAMQRAVPAGAGAMAAVLGLDTSDVEEIARAASAHGEPCEVANDNAAGQVVLSGATAAVQRAVELGRERGAKRCILLQVSAPFHCSLMAPAAAVVAEELARVELSVPSVPVIANITARPTSDPAALRELLVRQVTGRVRWRETLECARSAGVVAALEFGPGKVLAGLARRALPAAGVRALQDAADLDSGLELLQLRRAA